MWHLWQDGFGEQALLRPLWDKRGLPWRVGRGLRCDAGIG